MIITNKFVVFLRHLPILLEN